MKNTVEIKIYNQNHSLVNSMNIEVLTTEVKQLIKMITISAKKRNQYVVSQISR